jgi:hypothetical protein
MKNMTLFHGSNQDFSYVSLEMSRDKRDFGRGFYMTTLKEQALRWAQSMFVRHGGPGRYVYEFTLSILPDLRIKRFSGLDSEWLDMVRRNRLNGGKQHDYDIVWGPVADDDTMRTLALFVAGIYTEDMALSQLRFFKPSDQVSVHTERALTLLQMMRKEAYEK